MVQSRAPSTVESQATRAGEMAVTDRLWYKDAIIYQLHVKSFFDSNDDGKRQRGCGAFLRWLFGGTHRAF
jgi:hypothetical protein